MGGEEGLKLKNYLLYESPISDFATGLILDTSLSGQQFDQDVEAIYTQERLLKSLIENSAPPLDSDNLRLLKWRGK